jgi:predicted RNase H-like nuclease (RuvC/YqgF family)
MFSVMLDLEARRQRLPELSSIERDSVRQTITDLRNNVTELRAQMEKLKGPSGQIPHDSQVQRAEIAALDNRLRKIEAVIIEDPEKALSIPMLRKEIGLLREGGSQSAAALKQSVDQVYDMNKWLLGAMALSVLALAVSQFFRARKEAPAQPPVGVNGIA